MHFKLESKKKIKFVSSTGQKFYFTSSNFEDYIINVCNVKKLSNAFNIIHLRFFSDCKHLLLLLNWWLYKPKKGCALVDILWTFYNASLQTVAYCQMSPKTTNYNIFYEISVCIYVYLALPKKSACKDLLYSNFFLTCIFTPLEIKLHQFWSPLSNY